MGRLVIVSGPTGAGKTTHAMAVADEIGAVRFSIDTWMQTLFAKDMRSLDFPWIVERVERCLEQIGEIAGQILARRGSVVLDLGFRTRAQRDRFVELAASHGVSAEIHHLDAPLAVRRARVARRNLEKDPAVYAFEVTEQMFDFMEPRFEALADEELERGRVIGTA